MASTIIGTGNQFRFFSEDVVAYDEIPVGVYEVCFSKMVGYWIERTDAIAGPSREKFYGEHMKKIQRITRNYPKFDRSLGVMFSGAPGMGKSMSTRELAHLFQKEFELPVVIVKSNTPGVAEFIDKLGECMVLFDEFEKVFPIDNEDNSAQDQFLPLFDGLSSQKRLYVVTANNTNKLSGPLVNRPGRFHYHISFDYPGQDDVREFLTDNAPNAKPGEIEAAVRFTAAVPLNYDHLRAVAFELNLGDEEFSEFIGDINIKKTSLQYYNCFITLPDGEELMDQSSIDLFSAEEVEELTFYSKEKRVRIDIEFSLEDYRVDEDGEMQFKVISAKMSSNDRTGEEEDVNVSSVVAVPYKSANGRYFV